MEKLKSRKFWVGLVGVVTPIAVQVATGQVGWPEAVGLSTAAVVAYVLGQAHVDGAHATKRLE